MMNIDKFINDQLSVWPSACGNFRSLRNVETKKVTVGGLEVILQHNPARIISSAAKLDPGTLEHRKCFLCRENRPGEQMSIEFEGRKGRRYDILLNPYPIFRNHLVIAMKEHCPQSIWRRYVDMLDLAKALPDFTVFYNGPCCGASAPDHHHFQAASRGQMPLENDVDRLLDSYGANGSAEKLRYLASGLDASVFLYEKFLPGIFVISGKTSKSVAKMFYRMLDCAVWDETAEPEPKCNVLVWHKGEEFRCVTVFRSSHRSHHYFSSGEDHLTMSPGCADMAGCLVVPVAAEFRKIGADLAGNLLEEVALSREAECRMTDRLTRSQQEVSVGIMSGQEIVFEIFSDGAGPRKARYREGKVEYDGSLYDELFFEARTLSTMFAEPSFRLYGVTIGAGFHWERKEDQSFAGALKIIADRDRLTAVNVLGVEDYLVSVITSEMGVTRKGIPGLGLSSCEASDRPSLEFLKAHAVISRSWISRYAGSSGKDGTVIRPGKAEVRGHREVIRWYDREDHSRFDVCADDHCQRYQGLTVAACQAAKKAVDATWGQVLVYDGKICDARFSKCCGGVMEKFSTCWEDVDYDYLEGITDNMHGKPVTVSEQSFRARVLDDGEACFCGRATPEILENVLKPYDMETSDFFRWRAEYGREELSRLFSERSGLHIGEIQALVPLQRGPSGRISRLEIIGSSDTVIIGKELEIRKVLSRSHLKSSAFVIDYLDAGGNVLDAGALTEAAAEGRHTVFDRILLRGAGWGHGVGLCQIGAAVMASEGYLYKDILGHYYPGAVVSRNV